MKTLADLMPFCAEITSVQYDPSTGATASLLWNGEESEAVPISGDFMGEADFRFPPVPIGIVGITMIAIITGVLVASADRTEHPAEACVFVELHGCELPIMVHRDGGFGEMPPGVVLLPETIRVLHAAVAHTKRIRLVQAAAEAAALTGRP